MKCRSVMTAAFLVSLLGHATEAATKSAPPPAKKARTQIETDQMIAHGRYLATIGVCEACHTPPAVSDTPGQAATGSPSGGGSYGGGHSYGGTVSAAQRERHFRTDPNWFAYLDQNKQMAGGVPFVLRFGAAMSGLVVTPNLTPDNDTGLGTWSENDIVNALRAGKKKNGDPLFLFAPHTFYRFLADDDARSLAVYLKSLPPIRNPITPRSLPFPAQPQTPDPYPQAPTGRSAARAQYLMKSLVGCTECHSYAKDNVFVPFAGGDPADPFNGTFRLGPDLPLRQLDKGWATFPYPGYAVLYAPNLTRFGLAGDMSSVQTPLIVRAIREGIAPHPDPFGRPAPLAHVMMWQFYAAMTDDDVYSIAEYLKSLRYIDHDVPELLYFGTDWAAAFKQVFGEAPSANDRAIFNQQ